MIVYNMVTGNIPFKAKDKYALLLQIGNGSIVVNYPPDCPKVFQELIAECLQFKPCNRPTAYELLQRPLFANPQSPEPGDAPRPGELSMTIERALDLMSPIPEKPSSIRSTGKTSSVSRKDKVLFRNTESSKIVSMEEIPRSQTTHITLCSVESQSWSYNE